jgi:AcrR family transcriptional regulator
MPRGIPISERMRQRNRHHIFKVAAQLFLKQGYHETTMRQVAEAAGMGKSTIYDYFPSKEELMLYSVEQEMDSTYQEALRIANMNRPATEKLRRLFHALWNYLYANQQMAVLTARESSRLSEKATQRMATWRTKYRKILENVIRQGIQEGTFRLVDETLVASALHSMMTGSFYDWLHHGRPGEVEANADTLVELFLQGIQVPS